MNTTKEQKTCVLQFTEGEMAIIKTALEGMIHEVKNDAMLQFYAAPAEKLLNELYNIK